MSGARILELLATLPAAPSEHDFSKPLAGAGSLAQAVADAVLEVRPKPSPLFQKFGRSAPTKGLQGAH